MDFVLPYRKLAQAAGRVHRTPKDVGVVVFCDGRMLGRKQVVDANGIESSYAMKAYNKEERLGVLQERIVSAFTVVDGAVDRNTRRHVEALCPNVNIIELKDFAEDIGMHLSMLDAFDGFG